MSRGPVATPCNIVGIEIAKEIQFSVDSFDNVVKLLRVTTAVVVIYRHNCEDRITERYLYAQALPIILYILYYLCTNVCTNVCGQTAFGLGLNVRAVSAETGVARDSEVVFISEMRLTQDHCTWLKSGD